MSDGSSGRDPAPADEFDRELRELTDGHAGEPMFIEPSAAERAKAIGVRMRAQLAERGRGPRQLTVSLLLAVALLLAGGLSALWYAHFSGGAGTAAPAGASPSSQAAWRAPTGTLFTGTVNPVDLFVVPPADPFAGTPAEHWADGAAGIVAPAAKAVGGFTVAQVAAAYASARQLLIAANLDRQTLLGGPPAQFAKLLSARQRPAFLAGLSRTGLDKGGYPLSTRTLVASFAPGSTKFVSDVIKVHGSMRARAVAESGSKVLAIEVSYLFAYAVAPPHDLADWTQVIDHAYGSIDFARSKGAGRALQPWDRAVDSLADAQCGPGDGYIRPAYPSEQSLDFTKSGFVIGGYSLASAARGAAVLACGRMAG
jgi:hypothetical protein